MQPSEHFLEGDGRLWEAAFLPALLSVAVEQ